MPLYVTVIFTTSARTAGRHHNIPRLWVSLQEIEQMPNRTIPTALRLIFCCVLIVAVGSMEASAQVPVLPRGPAEEAKAEPEPLPLVEWTPVGDAEVKAQLSRWAENVSEPTATSQVIATWERLSRPAGMAMPRVQAFLTAAAEASPDLHEALRRLDSVLDLDSVEQLALSLSSSEFDRPVSENLRLLATARFVQHGFYDEALAMVKTVDIEQVVDPAALLFYRGVAEHQLVQLPEAKASLESLVKPDYPLPARYQQLAEMMLKDLEQVEPDSLGAIARQMSDVRRRLSLGAADKQVQGIEDQIVDNIDKMIEEIEKQMQQQQQQQMGGPPSLPMEDSQLPGGGGEGDVDIKDIGKSSGWGDLPPKERERIMQQIGRDFPSYYRDVIDEYFRRLATEQRDERP